MISTPQQKKLAMRRVERIHFVGIGGAGMSGIAAVLIDQGYEVSGSDQADSVVFCLCGGGGAVAISLQSSWIRRHASTGRTRRSFESFETWITIASSD